MSGLQAITDRVEIEALCGEFTDAVMMNDHDRLASLFTHEGALRIPDANVAAAGRQQIRALGERRQALADYFVQTTHPGIVRLDGDTASGRAYISELIHGRDGSSYLNYAVYHDRYQRTPDGWKFTERVYEVRYLDTTPLAGSAPRAGGDDQPRTESSIDDAGTAITDTSNTANRAKEFVVSAFAEFARGNTDILRSVLAPDLIEHSPGNPSGRDAFIEHILNQAVADASLDLKRVIADGDLVALHYHLVPNGGGRGQAVVDIWRVEGDRIAEHWAVVQDVPEPSETPHGMF